MKEEIKNAVELLRSNGYFVKPNGWDGDTMYVFERKDKNGKRLLYLRKYPPRLLLKSCEKYAVITLSELKWFEAEQ